MCDKEHAKEVFLAALSGVMPKNLIQQSLSYHDNVLVIEGLRYDLSLYNNVYVIGSGKASIEMAKAMQVLLGDKITRNLVVSNYIEDVENIEVIESTHPLPSQKSIYAGTKLIEAFREMQDDDFFIYLLSGGSSALIEKPIEGVSLEDFIETTKVLLHHGLSIDEINTVRKNLSQIKGGGLASLTQADGAVLVVSDVIGDDLQAIGSAPMLADNSSIGDVREIVARYEIFDVLPTSVQEVLKSDDKVEQKSIKAFPHYLIASNLIALECAKEKAIHLGFDVEIVTHTIEGDVQDVAKELVQHVEAAEDDKLYLFGGEPTVFVKGEGKGGRNQELCLWILKEMQKSKGFTFLSAGSDGIDGNSDAAGAVVCRDDYHDEMIAYLSNNDSYHYLKDLDTLIITGESGTNVMDIMIAIKKRS